ncbi:MAG: HU family DNA-binding protein [Candidatus Bipolaricaulia bacterium]
MNKSEFVDQLAKRTDMSKKDAQATLDAALDLIVQEVKKKNGKVQLTGFGTFETREQKETERINPQTGKKMKVPAKKVPKFRPGKAFKETLAKKK